MSDEGLFGDDAFGDPPETVARTVREMEQIAQRRAGNARLADERDTERYLVLVYTDRAQREAALAALGLPQDERYLYGAAVDLSLRPGVAGRDALILGERDCRAAPSESSGAAG